MRTADDTQQILIILGLGLLIWMGMALIIYSRALSLRYNAWTTGLRERHPNIIRPPTPEAVASDTKVMTWPIRFLGAVLIVDPIVEYILNRLWR